jgi:hypothetical protein
MNATAATPVKKDSSSITDDKLSNLSLSNADVLEWHRQIEIKDNVHYKIISAADNSPVKAGEIFKVHIDSTDFIAIRYYLTFMVERKKIQNYLAITKNNDYIAYFHSIEKLRNFIKYYDIKFEVDLEYGTKEADKLLKKYNKMCDDYGIKR